MTDDGGPASTGPPTGAPAVPRNRSDDYTEESAAGRRQFVREVTGVALTHVGAYSVEPATLAGNIENFAGIAQVPIGIAGPLRINGEHAQGDFYVPMATTEGTLVASYNRGMRLLTAAGGVRATVVDDRMQRAPVFVFDHAVAAREFGRWVEHHQPAIALAAEATTRVGALLEIEQYAVGPLLLPALRLLDGRRGRAEHGGPSHPRRLRVDRREPSRDTAVRAVRRDRHGQEALARSTCCAPGANGSSRRRRCQPHLLREIMGVEPKALFWARQLSQTGAFLAGSANNGAHAANGLAALFIATGQDAANVAESHAAIVYTQLLDSGDYYWSITLPALIVATVGGGTGLATQRECLELLGCFGPGKVRKLAEICAAVVLAGEISLSSAVLAGDWVSSHERLGRNRG